MILLFFVFLFYAFLFIPFGWFVFRVLGIPHHKNLAWLAAVGMSLLAFPIYLLHYFTGSKWYVFVATSVVAVVFWYLKRGKVWSYWRDVRINVSAWRLFFFILVTIIVLGYAALPANLVDDGFYYSPSIQWFEQFGLIKGLGNFDHNLVQASALHALESAFNFHFFGFRTNDLVGFVLWIFAIQVVSDAKKYSAFQLVLLSFSVLVCLQFISAPNTDVLITVFLLITLDMISSLYGLPRMVYLVVLMVVCMAMVKLTALLLIFIVPLLSLKKDGLELKPLVIALSGIAVFVFFKSFWLSGYAFFPFFNWMPMNTPWQMPEAYFAYANKAAELSAYLTSLPDSNTFRLVANKLVILFNFSTSRGLMSIFYLATVLLGILLLFSKRLPTYQKKVLTVVLLSGVTVFYFSPQARLVLPFGLATMFIFCGLVELKIINRWFALLPLALAFGLLFFPWQLLNGFFHHEALTSYKNIEAKFLLKPHLGWNNIETIQVEKNGIVFNKPTSPDFYCFHAPFPCTTLFAKDYLTDDLYIPVLLGASLKDGFGYQKIPFAADVEKELNSRKDGVGLLYGKHIE